MGMRKICLVLIGLCILTSNAVAGLREQNAKQTSQRTDNNTVVRSTQKRSVTSRSAKDYVQNNTSRTSTKKTVVGRSATQKTNPVHTSVQPGKISRAATTVKTRTFGDNYNSCRDAYFTCMDQFCANQNETYRRCVCSSKLANIQKQEKLLAQTDSNLKSFEDLNIDVISKNAAEVKAMGSASDGENAVKKDKSTSANTLKNISGVLNDSKKQSLSTGGKLDAGGDIKAIWSTTNLIGGTDIANLTGEALFNAVHSQCSEIVASACASSDLKMISSAYGMYIENDCSVLQKKLSTQTNAANASIRSTRHKMQDARYENYNVHNSVSINDCIAKVRADITADTACGKDYIHCLDFSGKFLNLTTGEAIYSPDFYQIENQLSLSGDILKNSKNTSFITMLDKKRVFAKKSLDLCQDDANDVWQEFLRQALVEIYQGQQKRVETVKKECLQIVNECYAKQSESLKNFADKSAQTTVAQTMVLSEKMCTEKLETCSNLYGGGPQGLETLIATMTGITDLTIEQSCPELLTSFTRSICAVSENDSMHAYPYGCRKYAPGESYYAKNPICNETLVNPFSRSDILLSNLTTQAYTDYTSGVCQDYSKRYTKCNFGYYLYAQSACANHSLCFAAQNGSSQNGYYATACITCPNTHICPGGDSEPVSINQDLYTECGQYYIGSLYQQLVRYALQNCTRPSNETHVLSDSLLAEVDKVAKSVRSALISELSKECSDLGGYWVDATWIDENQNGEHDKTGDVLFTDFYVSTGANKLWGYCKKGSSE